MRQMPKIYGDLRKPKRNLSGFLRWIRNLSWTLAGLALVYAVGFSGLFSLNSVQVEGAAFSSSDQIKGMVPVGRNIWLISKDKLSRQILGQPSVESVSILRGIPDSLRLVVHEKQPSLVWISATTAYVLAPDGTSFATFGKDGLPGADTAVGKLLAPLARVTDLKAVPTQLGAQVVSPLFIIFLQTSQKELASQLPQLTVDHWEITDTTYDVSLRTKQGLTVRLNSLGDAASQVRNLSRLLAQGKANPKTSTVDLRVDRWAYVIP